MMTPKERAVDLVIKMEHPFFKVSVFKSGASKELALIAVNLLMEEADGHYDYEGFIAYWDKVKQEISKI